MCLSGLPRLPHLGLALCGPLPLALGALLECRLLGVVLVEPLLGVEPGEFALRQERRPPAGVPLGAMRVVIDLDHVGDDPFEKGPIVADEQHRRIEPEDPSFEPIESVEVEVVGRFVEQEDVEPRRAGATPTTCGRPLRRTARRSAGRADPCRVRDPPTSRRPGRRSRRRRARANDRAHRSSGRRRRRHRTPMHRSRHRVRPAQRRLRFVGRGMLEPSRWTSAPALGAGARHSRHADSLPPTPCPSATMPPSAPSNVDLPTPLGPISPTR